MNHGDYYIVVSFESEGPVTRIEAVRVRTIIHQAHLFYSVNQERFVGFTAGDLEIANEGRREGPRGTF